LHRFLLKTVLPTPFTGKSPNWRSSRCVLHPQTRFSSGAENEEKSRTAIYTISHDAHVSACMLPTYQQKSGCPDQALNEAFGRQCRMIHLRNARWRQQVLSDP
jgi:hypothetical protein